MVKPDKQPSLDGPPTPSISESDRTIPPSDSETHGGQSSEQTILPSESVAHEPEAMDCPDQTIPPFAASSAETNAEAFNDQTILPSVSTPPVGSTSAVDTHHSNTFGDYEIIQEIARGGMGVVYKARQVSLNRTVALKKILSGQLAGEEDLKRFQVEAEASAQLDHVGIVPVYDFGQVDGQYFFSMGFVEGDDLAERIRERPMEAEASAEMMIKIAQAVGYANAKGVIHRDLKPSNVLLDGNNDPKVTDFGVAKQQGNDSEMTAQGQILGTPSYMPPEQAAGQGDVVDQRADVYALGAILYALLTGRPPFQAATAMETMIQVLDQDPVPISQLNSTIPRDLETICLKCLQKEPAKRYASAEALADDLQRYLNDEPIVARPPSKTEQLARWVRKNKATAIATGVVAASLLVATIISISYAFEAARQRDEAANQRDTANLAKQEADDQRQIAQEKTQEAKKSADKAIQRANELQQISDFQANQLSSVNPRQMGESIREMVIDRAQSARKRAGATTSELDQDMATLQSLLTGTDFTGIALAVLDKQIFAGAIKELDNFETQPLVQARLLQVVSDTLRKLGLVEQAVEPQVRALEIRKQALLPSDPNRLVSINNYGVLLKERGEYEAAELLLREALKNRQMTLGESNSDTLLSSKELCELLMTQRRLIEAESTLRKSLKVLQEKLGSNHPETLNTMSQLASVLQLANKRKEAVALLRKALANCRALKGDNHIDTHNAQLELGTLVIWEEPEAAAEFETITRQIFKEHEKKQSTKANLTCVKSLELMNECLMMQMKLQEMFETGEKLVARCRVAFGNEHVKTLDAMKSCASNGLLTENWVRSENILKDVLTIERPKLGGQNEQTLSTITLLAMVLANQNKDKQAEDLYREAFDGFKALNQDVVAKTVGGELGALILKRGDIVTAEPLLLAAWSLHKEMEDLYYLEEGVQVHVLKLFIAKGDYDAAESLQRKVLEGLIREKCEAEQITRAQEKLNQIIAARKAAVEEKNEDN